MYSCEVALIGEAALFVVLWGCGLLGTWPARLSCSSVCCLGEAVGFWELDLRDWVAALFVVLVRLWAAGNLTCETELQKLCVTLNWKSAHSFELMQEQRGCIARTEQSGREECFSNCAPQITCRPWLSVSWPVLNILLHRNNYSYEHLMHIVWRNLFSLVDKKHLWQFKYKLSLLSLEEVNCVLLTVKHSCDIWAVRACADRPCRETLG
jgi:hypothetical protein